MPNAARELHPGMGQAVAKRTVLRKHSDGSFESWSDVAHRVALGNSLLCKNAIEGQEEYKYLTKHVANASLLLSGRHLQHGDETQPERNLEVFTNCATAAANFVSFYCLMNGSGVGRCYDDEIILVDVDNAPALRCVLSHEHPDFDWSAHESERDAVHKYGRDSKRVMWFRVPDSREGWAQALEVWENAAFEKIHKDKMLILVFSDVRCKGSPIKGMQDRPASGPVPLMNAFLKAASLKGAGLAPWKQALYIDHYFGECVLVGGARRAARMSTKTWRDPGVVDFVRIKRPIEFEGLDVDEVADYRKSNSRVEPFLWSSNNSVTVDAEFWRLLDLKRADEEHGSELAKHARRVWKEVTACAYADGTGEPGLINVDKLTTNSAPGLKGAAYLGSKKYQPREETELYLSRLVKRASKMKHPMITNPCITGDMLIAVADGRNAVSIKQLAEEGLDVPVYSTDPVTGQVQIKMGRCPRRTGESREVWKLTLDDGSILRATPDHKVLTKNLQYVALQDLQPGESISPFNSFNSNGYRQVCGTGVEMRGGARRNKRQYRLIYEYYLGGVDPKIYAIHHADFDSQNDAMSNLEKMLHETHRRLHADRMMGEKNPYHRMDDQWKKSFASHPGETNGRYSGYTDAHLLEEGRKLFEKHGILNTHIWGRHAKEHGLPQSFSKFRFEGDFNNFKNDMQRWVRIAGKIAHFMHVRLVSDAAATMEKRVEMGVKAELQERGYALLCVSFPRSDLDLLAGQEDALYEAQFGKYQK